jgi:hypothetical protein
MQQQHESQSQVEVHDIVDDRLLLILGGLGQHGGLKNSNRNHRFRVGKLTLRRKIEPEFIGM